MDSITITLPLPAPALSPNARVHRMAKAAAVRKYREYAWAVTLEALGRRAPPLWKRARAEVTFYFPQDRRRDRDNFRAMLKAAWDGIVDAHLLADDKGLIVSTPVFKIDKDRPRVEITVEGAT